MNYNIFEYKTNFDTSLETTNFEIKIQFDGTIEYYSGENSQENKYKLTNDSLMKIKKVINENKNIFYLDFHSKCDESDKTENEFFFSNGEENIRIKTFNMTSFFLPNTMEVNELEEFEKEFNQKMMLLKVFFKICNILNEENYFLSLYNFDFIGVERTNLDNLFVDIENIETERQKSVKKGLTDTRKEEIQKELEEMNLEEVENEIERLSNDLESMLKKGVNNYWDTNYFEDVLFCSLEGKYVVDTCNEIREDLKNRYSMIVRKLELALEFCEKYYISDTREWELNRDTLFTNNMLNTNDDKEKKYEMASKICEENNLLYEGYEELYKKVMNLYLENDCEYEKYIQELKEKTKKIKLNIEKMSIFKM